MKKCEKCKKQLPKESFYKNKYKKDGIASTCKNCMKNYLNEYKTRKDWREKRYLQTVLYRKTFPDRYRAYAKVNNGKRDGKVKQTEACEHCGKKIRLEAAHTDYSKPLDVIWLCRKCHYAFDNL